MAMQLAEHRSTKLQKQAKPARLGVSLGG